MQNTVFTKIIHYFSSCLGVFLIVVPMILWNVMASGKISLNVIIWIVSFNLASIFLGDIFYKLLPNRNINFNNLIFKLTIGSFVLSILILMCLLMTSLEFKVIWIILLVAVSIVWSMAMRKYPKFHAICKNPFKISHESEIILILLTSIGVTFWCQDILTPLAISGDKVTIKSWPDIYYHLTQITSFASSKGLQSISDAQMAGAPILPYHMAGYLIPATLADFANASSLVVYQSFLVPFGLLIFTFSAYALASQTFGKWAGLAGALCMLLLPDAVAQGFGNAVFGYQWMLQTSPLLSYGIACAALVFIFLFEAIRTNKYFYIAAAYFFTIIVLIFKAHIFVAISYLVLIFPILFIFKIKIVFRVSLLIIASIIYLTLATLSQQSNSIPTLLLDGSALMPYSDALLSINDNGYIKAFFSYLFEHSSDVWLLRITPFLLMLYICVFGIFGILYLFQIKYLKNNFQAAARFFPFSVIAIYLIMASCLAMNERPIGTSDELLHRPFVWAYCITVLWATASLYYRNFGEQLPSKKSLRLCIFSLAITSLFLSMHFGKGIQTLQGNWGIGHQVFPTCEFSVARYINKNSAKNDLIQVSFNDGIFKFTALSERQSFVNHTGVRSSSGIKFRSDSVSKIKTVNSDHTVIEFMEKNHIKWYIHQPNDLLAWGDELKKNIVYECDNYKVYKF